MFGSVAARRANNWSVPNAVSVLIRRNGAVILCIHPASFPCTARRTVVHVQAYHRLARPRLFAHFIRSLRQTLNVLELADSLIFYLWLFGALFAWVHRSGLRRATVLQYSILFLWHLEHSKEGLNRKCEEQNGFHWQDARTNS